MLSLVIISYIVIIYFETISLLKEKRSGKIVLYFSMIIFSMIITVLLTLGIQLPSPSNGLKSIVLTILGKDN